MFTYFDQSRESDPHALPDLEVFRVECGGWSPSELCGDFESDDTRELEPGWYWWACFPGCLPDGEPVGPFGSMDDAIQDARSY